VPPREPTDRPVVAGEGISHPDHTLFPDVLASKLDLARYYEDVSPWMLRDLIDQPLTLVHCSNGVPRSGAQKGVDCRFMKHAKGWERMNAKA
jgi:DNA primase